MKWPAWSKWPLLGVAVTAVVLAAPPGDGREAAETAAPARPQQAAPPAPRAATHEKSIPAERQGERVQLERLKRARPEAAADNTDVANAFNAVSWYEPPPPPPPPPPQQAVPEPAPVAPPVPFTYFGRYEDPSKRVVMLARNEKIYAVSEGDVIDETYRVGHIADGSVSLVYLPLGTNQSIRMGAK